MTIAGDDVKIIITQIPESQPKAPDQYRIIDQYTEKHWIELDGENWVIAHNLIEDRIEIQPGLYRHYKGDHYAVAGTAYDTERELDVVIYFPCYPCPYKVFTVSTKKFTQTVEVDGKPIPRFAPVNQLP